MKPVYILCHFILLQEQEGWWEGVKKGVTGVFPSNFVEVLQDEAVSEVEKGDIFCDIPLFDIDHASRVLAITEIVPIQLLTDL